MLRSLVSISSRMVLTLPRPSRSHVLRVCEARQTPHKPQCVVMSWVQKGAALKNDKIGKYKPDP